MTQRITAKDMSAAEIRRKARDVLDGGRGHRLTLILATVVVLTAAVGAFILGEAVYAVGYLIFGDHLWVDVAAYCVMGLLAIFGVLPLAMGAYRLACLACPPKPCGVDLPVATAKPVLAEVFYPFTSRRAYGRSMLPGLELLGWGVLMAVIPIVGYRGLAALYDYLAAEGYLLVEWRDPLTMLTGVGLLLFGLLVLFLSGYRAGFAYLVFVHDPLPLGEVNRYFKGFRRSLVRPLCLRLSLAGWVAVSILAILVPFVAHTIPYGMCCSAVYGAELRRK